MKFVCCFKVGCRFLFDMWTFPATIQRFTASLLYSQESTISVILDSGSEVKSKLLLKYSLGVMQVDVRIQNPASSSIDTILLRTPTATLPSEAAKHVKEQ